MRIIRGRFARRKLLTNPGMTTRPITDRVKETLFEYLHDELPGQKVADICAGTGTLGLEAVSRGAVSSVFIEKDPTAFDLLKKNIAALKLQDATLCWSVDIFRTSFHPKNCEHLLPFNLVFFDPPYRMVQSIAPGSPLYKSLQRLARDGITHPGTLMLFRTPDGAQFTLPDVWQPDWKLEFSTMDIHWFRRAELDGSNDPHSEDDAAVEQSSAVSPES